MRRTLATLVWCWALAGCSAGSINPRQACVREALDRPLLHDGVAVFTGEGGGVSEARSGWLNRRDGTTVMAVASLTKPLVAAEIRRRIDAGQLRLDQPMGAILSSQTTSSVSAAITVQQLLQHRAGFDRRFGDPLFAADPASCRDAAHDVLRRAPEQPLGRQVLYSNAGYCVLGEIILASPEGVDLRLLHALKAPLGGAGGWRGSLRELHTDLLGTLPIRDLETFPALSDGSYYGYAWRHWPEGRDLPPWSHFGRLPGIVSIALSDGDRSLLVAQFRGDPPDVDIASQDAALHLWRCLQSAS